MNKTFGYLINEVDLLFGDVTVSMTSIARRCKSLSLKEVNSFFVLCILYSTNFRIFAIIKESLEEIMKMFTFISFVLTLSLYCFSTRGVLAVSTLESEEGKLIKNLLQDYDVDVKPTLDPHDVVNVSISFYLTRLESVNEKTQVVRSFGFLILVWQDAFLQWNETDNGVSRFVIDANRVWLPEISFSNSVTEGVDLSRKTRTRAIVLSSGHVVWAPPMKWETYCEVNLLYFPNDVQRCNISFVNFMYSDRGIKFQLTQDKVDSYFYEPNGEWVLEDSNTFLYSLGELGVTPAYPVVGFTIKLRRRPMYFVLNIIVPCVFLSIASITVFVLPVESGEKVSLSITIMLAYSVLLLFVSDITPRSGTGQPYLSFYVVVSMGITAVSLIVTVIIIAIFHHDPRMPVPNWVRKVFLCWLSQVTWLRIRRESDPKIKILVTPVFDEIKAEDESNENSDAETNLSPRVPNPLEEHITHMVKKDQKHERIKENKMEWRMVSGVIDAFCLYATILATIGITLFLIISLNLGE